MTTFRVSVMLAATAAAVALAGASARAEEGVAIKNLLGSIGIITPEKEPIRYNERAPLVLPPKMDLREPSAGRGAQASNPQWPNDPDVMAKKRRAAEARVPITESETRRMSENNPRLSVEELRGGRNMASGRNPDGPVIRRGDSAREELLMTPDQLRAGVKREDPDTQYVNGEPLRRTLTEPPTGLRRTSTGAAPIATASGPRIDQQQRDADPRNWLLEQKQQSED